MESLRSLITIATGLVIGGLAMKIGRKVIEAVETKENENGK
ncbi:MAG: hypothetical protein AB1403_09495 [Candidatus Riflebacteria bacterium]